MIKKSLLSEYQNKKIVEETNILRNLDHPNILKILEFFDDENFFYIVTEICKGGELFDEIVRRKKFSENCAVILMKQIFQCVNYCHKNQIVHRDLKPENIMLEENKDFSQIKIIDFGVSRHFEIDEILYDMQGSSYYIAPEVLDRKYNEKCDIWSCGVILYIILSGTPPFNGKSEYEIHNRIKEGSISFSDPCWSTISDNAKNLITKLLAYDSKHRLSAEEALNHPWITEMSDQ